MQEKTLLRISLVITIIGLVFLFFYTQEYEIPKVTSLETIPPEEKVMVQGVIKKMSTSEKTIFMEISGQQLITMDVIAFPEEEPYLQEGDDVKIQGTVETYKGKKEIIADKIVKS